MKNLTLYLLLLMSSCKEASHIQISEFGTLSNGQKVQLYSLKNKKGMEVRITNYGGTIVYWTAPDKDNKYENICLGYKNIEDYEKGSPYFGAIIGRYGNRIASGKFSIGGITYQLMQNDRSNSLHGGTLGFDKVIWDATVKEGVEPQLILKYLSKDGEEGFPGNLNVTVSYQLLKDNSLKIDYYAETDKKTVVNLTNHTYFNLSGNFDKQISNHYLPVDATLIPTGEIREVKGSPFDFTSATPISRGINDSTDHQIMFGSGYDHCWVFSDSTKFLKSVAIIKEPETGREMEVLTTEPGVQFYAGNFLDGKYVGKGKEQYHYRTGFCLETQHFPDSPNQPAFPSTLLKPNEIYKSTTIYKFH